MTESRTLQVRRYRIAPDRFADYIAWWQAHIPRLRGEAGFTIEFAAAQAEASVFLWGVSSEGDVAEFRRREAHYMDLPHRLAAFEGVAEWVQHSEVAFMTPLVSGGAQS